MNNLICFQLPAAWVPFRQLAIEITPFRPKFALHGRLRRLTLRPEQRWLVYKPVIMFDRLPAIQIIPIISQPAR